MSVSDGKFRTFADVQLHVWSITDDMAENAVVIRFREMSGEEFMTAHKPKLLQVRNKLSAHLCATVNKGSDFPV